MELLPERLRSKIMVAESGCWLWTASLDRGGYGQVFTGSKRQGTARIERAHRVVYTLLVGPIPEGLDLDHLCHDAATCTGGVWCPHRRCVRPDHLTPATNGENVGRALRVRPRATHCPHGHEFTPENTAYVTRPGRAPYRRCRTCHREQNR